MNPNKICGLENSDEFDPLVCGEPLGHTGEHGNWVDAPPSRSFSLTICLDEFFDSDDEDDQDSDELSCSTLDFKIPEGAKINARLLCGMLSTYARELLEKNEDHLGDGKGFMIKGGDLDPNYLPTSSGDRGML